ncbi:MAG TPA: glutathione S-transferase family protein [Kofleriaceae bacterium]|jgi:glutathione S-transferase|nr:glutathione S-transferase family protein [Kofleriaceae bacterium]
MITLYHSPGMAGLVVHWLLLELGLAHDWQRVNTDAGEHKQPAYLALNPAGLVPTIVIDGQPITEAAAIALYLADADPDHRFVPAPGLARAAYYQWMLYFANTLQPAFRAWFYPTEPAGEAHVDAAKAAARARIESGWDRIDAHLAAHGPYMLGDAVTTPDFLAVMLMRWSRNMPRPATQWPAIARFVAAMRARPAWNELYAREGLTEWL